MSLCPVDKTISPCPNLGQEAAMLRHTQEMQCIYSGDTLMQETETNSDTAAKKKIQNFSPECPPSVQAHSSDTAS